MRKLILYTLCICLIAALFIPSHTIAAAAEEEPITDPRPDNAPPMAPALSEPLGNIPFEINAPSVLLCEAKSGKVVFEKNADEQRPVASVTKMMSLLLVFEAIRDGRMSLDQTVRASKNAAGMGGSQALLDADTDYIASDLLKSVIVASANDATVALAETLYGSEEAFVRRMNGRAAELNLSDTVYKNSTGLPVQGQFTSARDVAKLSMMLMDFPLYFEYSTIWMDELIHPSGRKTDLVNTNRLIRSYAGADGFKTGSTSEAMFCVSASAVRDGMRLIAVVLGAPSSNERFSAAAKMLDYGFDHYYLTEVVRAGAVVRADVPVSGSTEKTADVVAKDDILEMIMKGEEAGITFETVLPETLVAPIRAGEQAGEIIVYKDGVEIGRGIATVADDIEEAGFFGSILRILRAWFD